MLFFEFQRGGSTSNPPGCATEMNSRVLFLIDKKVSNSQASQIEHNVANGLASLQHFFERSGGVQVQ